MLDYLQQILDWHFYGNSGEDYLLALGVAIGSYIILRIIRKVILVRLEKFSKKTANDIDDAFIGILSKVKVFSYLLVSVYLGTIFLTFPDWLDKGLKFIFLAVLVFESIQAVQRIIKYFIVKGLAKDGDDSQAKATYRTLNIFIQIILWSLGLLLILSNMGVNITTLIAGLGIGGIAIALAMQNILSDVFSSFTILIDKPFKVTDFIKVGDDMGVVEKIGIKSTRLKTLDGQMLIISNRELTNVRIENFQQLKRRRALFNLGVTYETDREKLEAVPKIIADIVSSQEIAELDRCNFKSYGDFSLNFETSIYIDAATYNEFLNTLEQINLDIYSKFKEKGIEFAYPTHLEYQKDIS